MPAPGEPPRTAAQLRAAGVPDRMAQKRFGGEGVLGRGGHKNTLFNV